MHSSKHSSRFFLFVKRISKTSFFAIMHFERNFYISNTCYLFIKDFEKFIETFYERKVEYKFKKKMSMLLKEVSIHLNSF